MTQEKPKYRDFYNVSNSYINALSLLDIKNLEKIFMKYEDLVRELTIELDVDDQTTQLRMRNYRQFFQKFCKNIPAQVFQVDDDLGRLFNRNSFSCHYFYFKVLLIVKLWSGSKITPLDLQLNSPMLRYYLKFLLELKFKRKFDDDWFCFEQQLLQLGQYFIPKRTDQYVIFLFNQMRKKLLKMAVVPVDELYSFFYRRFFENSLKPDTFRTIFKPCSIKGISFKVRGTLLAKTLRNSVEYSKELLDSYEYIKTANLKKIIQYFKRNYSRVVQLFKNEKYPNKGISNVITKIQYVQKLQPFTGFEIDNSFSFFFFNNPKIPFDPFKVDLDSVNSL